MIDFQISTPSQSTCVADLVGLGLLKAITDEGGSEAAVPAQDGVDFAYLGRFYATEPVIDPETGEATTEGVLEDHDTAILRLSGPWTALASDDPALTALTAGTLPNSSTITAMPADSKAVWA